MSENTSESEAVYVAYLASPNSRDEIEDALTVEFLLEDPDLGCVDAFWKAFKAWEHSRVESPVVQTKEKKAEAIFSLVSGARVCMRIEMYRGRVRLRSMCGTPAKRRKAERLWNNFALPPAVLCKVAKLRRASMSDAATMGR